MSIDRISSPESQRIINLREEAFALQDSLENSKAENRKLKAEVRDLSAEVLHFKSKAEHYKTELRDCHRRKKFLNEVRAQSREEAGLS